MAFQVNASDRLSGRICHGCISFLNSWTSFKGRCGAAQRQQKSWLAGQLKRQLGLQANSSGEQLQENGEDDDDKSGEQPSMDVDETEAYNYYPQYHRMVSVLSSFTLSLWTPRLISSLCSPFRTSNPTATTTTAPQKMTMIRVR